MCTGSGGWEWDGRWREEAGEASGEEWTPGNVFFSFSFFFFFFLDVQGATFWLSKVESVDATDFFQDLGAILTKGGHFGKIGAVVDQKCPKCTVCKIIKFNEHFDKLGVKFVNFGQKRWGHMCNFPCRPLAEQVDDTGPFAEQALQVDKKNHTFGKEINLGGRYLGEQRYPGEGHTLGGR